MLSLLALSVSLGNAGGTSQLTGHILPLVSPLGRSGLATVPLPVPLGAVAPTVTAANAIGPHLQRVGPAVFGNTQFGTWVCGVISVAGGALHGSRRKQQVRRRGGRQVAHGTRPVLLDGTVAPASIKHEFADDFHSSQDNYGSLSPTFVSNPGQIQGAGVRDTFEPGMFLHQNMTDTSGVHHVFPAIHESPEALAQKALISAADVKTVWVPVGWMPVQQAWNSELDGWQPIADQTAAAPFNSQFASQADATVPSSSASKSEISPMSKVSQSMTTFPKADATVSSSSTSKSGISPMSKVSQSMTTFPKGTWADWSESGPSATLQSTADSAACAASSVFSHNTNVRCSAKDAASMTSRLKGADAEKRGETMEYVVRNAWALSLSRHGCRVVQVAVDVAASPERMRLIDSMKGHVLEATRSPHANHVLQKYITVLAPESMRFVTDELSLNGLEIAKHPFGCRVFERLLEHCPHWQSAGLADEAISSTVELAKHPYGNYVIQHILEHGSDNQRSSIVTALMSDLRRLAKHKSASNVVEKAWIHSSQEHREQIRDEINSNPSRFSNLEHSNYGSFVVKEMKRR